MAAAAAFLSVRQRSVEETRRRLKQLGYPPPLCDRVVDRLVELAYLDDDAFARAWVESRDRARPRGAVALRRELKRKGVPDETIRRVLQERADATTVASTPPGGGEPSGSVEASADEMAARRLLERRWSALSREPDPRRRRQRAYALLARNGFDPDICRVVSADVLEPSAELVEGSADDADDAV